MSLTLALIALIGAPNVGIDEKIPKEATNAHDVRHTNHLAVSSTDDRPSKSVSNRKHRHPHKRNSANDGNHKSGRRQGLSYEATAYTAFCNTGCIGVTATGVDVSNTVHHKGRRVVAVDPNVIPLGTLLKVTTSGGWSFKAIAADTGGAIKGRRIDILVSGRKKALNFGRQDVQVKVIQ